MVVFWFNIGREHADLHVAGLLSMGATTVLCLFWTIPMAFISSLSSVKGLKEEFDWIADAIDNYPGIEPVLEQLAPLLVVAVNEA